MKLWRSVALALAAFAVDPIASAQPREGLGGMLRVTDSPDGCVTEAALEPRVQRWLEGPLPPGEIAVAVHAEAPAVAFSVLRREAVIAERRFDVLPADCGDRLDAIAVAIAVAIEHAISPRAAGTAGGAAGGSTTGASPTAPRTSPAQTPENAAGEATEPPPAEAAPAPGAEATTPEEATPADAAEAEAADEDEDDEGAEPSPVRSAERLFAGAGLLLAVLPETTLAIDAGGELQRSALRFGAAGLFTLQTETPLAGGRVSAQLLGARAHTCLGRPVAAFDLEGCAGVAGGVVLASGDGFTEDQDAAMVWLAGVVRAAVRYPESSPISLRLALDGLLSAVRPELETKAPTAATDARGVLGAAATLELVIALP